MKRVSRIADFPSNCNIATFFGKDYSLALKEAEAWESRTGNTVYSYYEQIAGNKSKSILVSYSREEIADENS